MRNHPLWAVPYALGFVCAMGLIHSARGCQLLNGFFFGRCKEKVLSKIGFIDEVLERLAGVMGIIPVNGWSDMVVFLQDIPGQVAAENEELLADCAFVENEVGCSCPVCTVMAKSRAEAVSRMTGGIAGDHRQGCVMGVYGFNVHSCSSFRPCRSSGWEVYHGIVSFQVVAVRGKCSNTRRKQMERLPCRENHALSNSFFPGVQKSTGFVYQRRL